MENSTSRLSGSENGDKKSDKSMLVSRIVDLFQKFRVCMGVFRGGGAPPNRPQKLSFYHESRRRIDWRHFSCRNAKPIGYESQTTQLRSVVLTN